MYGQEYIEWLEDRYPPLNSPYLDFSRVQAAMLRAQAAHIGNIAELNAAVSGYVH